MESRYDYKKFAVLYVDDEVQSLKYFTLAFGETFRVFTAPNAQEGLKIFERHADEIGILMTDQRMPGEKGVWLLEKARALRPNALRMLVTAFADMDAAIAAVNTGAIYKYITKPWEPEQLETTLKQALEFFAVRAERDALLREKMIADRFVSLGLFTAGLNHHIKNSMVAVKTFLELAPLKLEEEKAGAELRDPEFWRGYLADVRGQAEKVSSLLGDLRSVFETNPNCEKFPDEISLKTLFTQRVENLRDALANRRITVANEIPESLPALRADRPKLEKLVSLLLQDELALLPAGSVITVTAEVQGEAAVVKLADNGPALPTAVLQAVLDPFTMTGGVPSEYGINLMACFFLAHHHGGKIEAHSQPGGNVFTVRLPLKQNAQRALLDEDLWKKLLVRG